MATTRIINGVEYVIPPGTEDRWTPPDEVVVTPPRDTTRAIDAITGLKVQAIVRNQNEQKVLSLVSKLEGIYQSFLDKKITLSQLSEQLGNFRNNDLANNDPKEVDDVTIQCFEHAILKALAESNQ
jgi:hypothetical protein